MKRFRPNVRVSKRAYEEIKRRAADDERFRSRGAVGVIDWLLFGEFTENGRGEFPHKKPIDKR